MTVKLNNIKRKKGLFYLIAIAVMVAIVGISCSESPTAPANFSETEDFIEAPAPEQTPSIPEEKPSVPEVKPEQTPTAPVLKITANTGLIQFNGKTFENSTLRVEIKDITLENNSKETIFVLSDGRQYGWGLNEIIKGQTGLVDKITYTLPLRNHSYSSKDTATFTKDGYLHLSIGGKNQTLELVK